MTRRWTRSPNREVFGVVAGFAEWKDLPIKETRLVVFLIILFTSVFPGLVIYLLLAIYLPLQTDEDIISPYEARSFSSRKGKFKDAHYEDVKWSEKSTDDLKKEYEELKKKVEELESEMFDKEKDWDERFRDSEDRK